MNGFSEQAGRLLARIREQKPLIHQITNYVVMNDTANVTLHIGALPVMGERYPRGKMTDPTSCAI